MQAIDFRKPDIWVTITNKNNNEIIASGKPIAFKEIPEFLFSFDYKYFFTMRENDLYTIDITYKILQENYSFDKNKYEDKIFPYVGTDMQDRSGKYIFMEHDIKELDPEIAPLVYALNNVGYKTTGSCCGHKKRIAWVHIVFEDFMKLNLLVNIIKKDKFKNDFQITTNPNIINTTDNTIMLSLQTYQQSSDEIYNKIIELANYIKTNCSHLNKKQDLRL